MSKGLLLVEGELEALHRYWARMGFLCFQALQQPSGEPGYRVDLDRLGFCIMRLRYLEEQIAKRDIPLTNGQDDRESRQRDRSEHSVESDRRGRG